MGRGGSRRGGGGGAPRIGGEADAATTREADPGAREEGEASRSMPRCVVEEMGGDALGLAGRRRTSLAWRAYEGGRRGAKSGRRRRRQHKQEGDERRMGR
ncbi:hypothetical protein E2562_025435 [Oryza meyeriana var. granulata]|uniref:DUF834 domain-containing protein n=1 Tax=Oryza meyeriana var. granulata TaxID=110450 RepID=A0A6G1D7S2_9ORYZ|nr:hypothetical protein E2562_025435 [Oryza meyeriana var. granulata]